MIGLDIGGTKIAACRITGATAQVQQFRTIPTRLDKSGPEILADCSRLVAEIAAEEDEPIGLGICELVSADGQINSAYSFDWRGLDLTSAFGSHPLALVESDVRAAAFAEWQLTDAISSKGMIFVVVGTGLACALITPDGMWHGAHGHAMVLGGTGLEDMASGRGLSTLLSTHNLAAAFEQPELPTEILAGANALGSALGVLVNALDPDLVVIGGGLGMNDRYRSLVEASMRAPLYSPITRGVSVRASKLGQQAGALGAALLATNRR